MRAEISPTLFWIFGGLFLLYALVRGWRRGVVRQSCNILAIVAGYFAAVFGSRLLVPIVHGLGYPHLAVSLVVGAILGMIVYISISAISAILFKKTSQQEVMLVRFGFGLGGALLGAGFGLLLLWFSVIALRVLGTVAETEMKVAQGSKGSKVPRGHDYQDPGALVRGLAEVKHSIEQSQVGAMIERFDPLPGRVYATMSKTTRVLSNDQSAHRFMEFPGVKKLSENAKIRALLNDPEIAKAARSRNYLQMMKNPHMIQALDDPAVLEMVKRVELEKALDYALAEKAERQRD